jgi:uncharacterized membrane protein
MTSPSTSWNGADGNADVVADVACGVHAVVDQIERAATLDPAAATLQPFARRLARSGAGPILRGEWLGHALHPMLTDLPIGCWTSSFVLDLLGGKSSRKASTRLIGLGLLTAIPTAASGAVEWNDVEQRAPRRVGVVHAAANTVALVLYFGSWRARHRGHHLRGLVLGAGGALAATVGGHLGGHLAFAHGIGEGARGRFAASASGQSAVKSAISAA